MNEPEISNPAELDSVLRGRALRREAELHMQRQLTALAELVKRLEGERGTRQRTDD